MSDRGVKWDAKTHPEEELWVCPSCDAHLHVDCVGDKCPACGEPIEDTPENSWTLTPPARPALRFLARSLTSTRSTNTKTRFPTLWAGLASICGRRATEST
jgi:uncharacterized paraquat-inducible protein A